MQVYLFNYSKRKNSTARPTLTGVTPFDCQLKDETSVMNPILIFNPATQGMPVPFNPSYYTYAFIPNFSRYYFITDWEWINGLWQTSLTVDVLASFKTAIGSTSAYVERAASASNGALIDGLYPTNADVQIQYVTATTSWYNIAPSGGTYVVGCINYQSSNHVGAVAYYALSTDAMSSLFNFLFSDSIYNASSISEIGSGLYKSIFNPFQYVVSCIWFPYDSSAFGSTSSTVKVGYWDTGVSAIMVSALLRTTFIEATIPNHPQISRGLFLNQEPFTRLTLFCEPFGEIPIDTAFTRKGSLLNGTVWIDHITGQATLRLTFIPTSQGYPTAASWFAERTAMFGVPIQLAQVMSDYSSAVNSAASGLSGGLTGAIMGLIGATVQSGLASMAPKVSTMGSNGSFLMCAPPTVVVIEHRLLADEDNTDLGRPLMETRTISTLSGYVKCAEVHFSAAVFDAERDMVNQFMKDGFFYE